MLEGSLETALNFSLPRVPGRAKESDGFRELCKQERPGPCVGSPGRHSLVELLCAKCPVRGPSRKACVVGREA